MFYEAVKNDMANSKETSFNNTISSTLSFITVLFEGLFEVVNIQAVLAGEKEKPKPSITASNKTNISDGYEKIRPQAKGAMRNAGEDYWPWPGRSPMVGPTPIRHD